jgi:hypothetical protein
MTWTPIDLAAVAEANRIALLKVAGAGRTIELYEDPCEGWLYRFENVDSDWGDDIPDGSMWGEEIVEMVRDGLFDSRDRQVYITDAGRAYLAEVAR